MARCEVSAKVDKERLDFGGLAVWADFDLRGTRRFAGPVPEGPADAVLIRAGPGAPGRVRQIRRSKDLVTVPVFVVGGVDQTFFDAGADECVERLDQAAVARMGRMRKRLRDLWARSETDGLTLCYTRNFLEAYLAAERRPYCVIMCDLDLFKDVNDTYGHAAGDEVLRQFGGLLRRTVRKTDVAARWGGEEFVVVLPEASAEQSVVVAEKVCAGWRGRVVSTPRGVIAGTVSIGVAGPAGPRAITDADAALYAAKESGRDRVVRFDQVPGGGVPGSARLPVGDQDTQCKGAVSSPGIIPPTGHDPDRGRAGIKRVPAIEGEPAQIVDRVASLVGEFTLLAFLRWESGFAYRVTEARGAFAGQLTGEEVALIAGDGVGVFSGGHWLFGLSGETMLVKRGDAALLIGKKRRFNKTERRQLEELSVRG